MNSDRARVVDGHIVRDGSGGSSPVGNFSFRRFLFLSVLTALLVITNPANDMKDKATSTVEDVIQQLQDMTGSTASRSSRRQSGMSDWAWQKMLDPPLSVTNYGIFTVEDRNTKVVFSGATQTWACSYYDDRIGDFCNAIAKNMCHGGPLLYNAKNYAYTAHRCICFFLIAAALLSFCYCGHLPAGITSEPLLRALLTSVGRNHFSVVSLGLDLFNASMFVYPALVKMEKVVPMLQEGAFASNLGLPAHYDFIFYVIVLVLFLGGGSNALTNFFFSKNPCFGFDSTVAAAVAYCRAHQASVFSFGAKNSLALSPQTVFWSYLPVTALLGGSPSHAVSWLLAGAFGMMLGEYHVDNRNWLLTFQHFTKSFL